MSFATIDILKQQMQSKRNRQKSEHDRLNQIREESIFEYKLRNDFDKIQQYLREDNVKYVDIHVEDKDVNKFIKAINSDKRYKDFNITHLGEGKYRVILLYT